MWFRRISGVLVLAFGLALSGILPTGAGTAQAQNSSEIFTIRNVPVDETAATAADARQTALAVGQRRAFRRLMNRLVPEDQQSSIPVLDSNLLQFYVQDFSVDNERTSAVRYLADLTFRFNADEVRRLLRGNSVGFAETRSKPLLVLPVFVSPEAGPSLWFDPNPWRDTWAGRPGDRGLVPMTVPIGDLGDIAAIDGPRAIAGDPVALRSIAGRYDVEDVMLTELSLTGDPDSGSAVLEVVTRRFQDAENSITLRDKLVQVVGEPYEALLERAASRIDSAVQEDWKQQNVLQFGNQRSILVFVPLETLDDWLKVRRRLDGVAAIQQTGITNLSRDEAQLEISFLGDEQRLTRALAQRDLFLALRQDSNWELTLAERQLPASPELLPEASGETPAPVPLPQ